MTSALPPGTAALCDSLCRLLQQELEIYNEMHELLGREQQQLLSMKVELLSDVVARKETLALLFKALDESRKGIARRLASILEINMESLTISRICELVPESIARSLKSVSLQLRDAVERCQETNRTNERAARKGMELVNGMIEYLLKDADPSNRVYESPVKKSGPMKGYGPGPGGSRPGLISQQV
jgi:flagellar biosynthesis/type III secretory pathway chaperone